MTKRFPLIGNRAPIRARILLLSLLCVLLLCSAVSIAVAQDPSLWTPVPLRFGDGSARVHLIMVDISKSMLDGRLLERAKPQIAGYIAAAPASTYLILAKFGTTADVVAHGYPGDAGAEDYLRQTVSQLRATHGTTNLDEAAKLVEWISLKLKDSSDGRPIDLNVTVLSDEISSPDPDKPTFSLRRYFAQHLAGSNVELREIGLNGTEPRGRELHPLEGYTGLITPVDSLKRTLEKGDFRQLAGKSTGPRQATAPTASSGASNGGRPNLAWILGVFAALGLAVAAGLPLLRRRHPAPPVVTSAPPESGRIPTSLEVNELLISETQGTTGRRHIRSYDHLPLIPGAPITFGVDPARNTIIVEGFTDPALHDLFELTVTENGLINVLGARGVLCNDKPIPRRGVQLPPSIPFQVQMGDRVWQIVASAETEFHESQNQLFRRLAGTVGADQPTVSEV